MFRRANGQRASLPIPIAPLAGVVDLTSAAPALKAVFWVLWQAIGRATLGGNAGAPSSPATSPLSSVPFLAVVHALRVVEVALVTHPIEADEGGFGVALALNPEANVTSVPPGSTTNALNLRFPSSALLDVGLCHDLAVGAERWSIVSMVLDLYVTREDEGTPKIWVRRCFVRIDTLFHFFIFVCHA